MNDRYNDQRSAAKRRRSSRAQIQGRAKDIERHRGLPKERPASRAHLSNGSVEEFDWAAFVSHFVHPIKVAIVEAMRWIGEPLSSSECSNLFGPHLYSLGVISYHMSSLANAGVIEKDSERQARGARETYYYLAHR